MDWAISIQCRNLVTIKEKMFSDALQTNLTEYINKAYCLIHWILKSFSKTEALTTNLIDWCAVVEQYSGSVYVISLRRHMKRRQAVLQHGRETLNRMILNNNSYWVKKINETQWYSVLVLQVAFQFQFNVC